MKLKFYIFTFIISTSCGRSNPEQKPVSDTQNTPNSEMISTNNNIRFQQNSIEEAQNEEDYRSQSLSEYDQATLFNLTDTITADFNGDGTQDKAFYKKANGTSGIIIIHGKTNEEVRIGFGKPFAHMTEFDWVDYWGLVEDKETSETTFTEDGDVSGTKNIKLQNPSLVLGAEEVGGGLITFLNGKYVWIHQTC